MEEQIVGRVNGEASRSGAQDREEMEVVPMMSTEKQVRQEAVRIALWIIKEELHRQGHKISHFDHAQLMKAARKLVREDPSILERARKEIRA